MSYDPSRPLVVAFGGGVNSTAMLCGFKERGLKPDLILFADTGGELPETYQHLDYMQRVVKVWWGHESGIQIVRATYKGEFEGLEKNCLRVKMLPSLAYGRKGCSQKYKVQPQTRRLLHWMLEKEIEAVTKAIGYDAGESHRKVHLKSAEHPKGRTEHFWFPLIEWGWRRSECIDAIHRNGLIAPGKSACFFCPAMKRGEVVRLKHEHPDLYARALAIEDAANGPGGGNKTPRGLTGRSFMWADIGAEDDSQSQLWDYLDKKDELGIPCGCFDG